MFQSDYTEKTILIKSQNCTENNLFQCKWLTSLLSSLKTHLSDIRPLSTYKWLIWSSQDHYVQANVHSNHLTVRQRCTERGIPLVVFRASLSDAPLTPSAAQSRSAAATVSRNCVLTSCFHWGNCSALHTTVAVLHIQYAFIYKVTKNVCWALIPHTLYPCITRLQVQ